MRNDLPISQDKKFKYSITFQSFDEESLEIGETDDKGYEVEETTDTIGEILHEANTTYGIYMPVSFGNWESTEPEEDTDYFEKGIRKFYGLHISNEDGTDISQEENDFITFLLSDGRYEINKFRDYAVGGVVLGTVALGVGALIAYFYFKGKKTKKEVVGKGTVNNRAKSVTHIIKGKKRKFPIKDAWKREHTLENKSEKYEVPQADRKPIKYEMGGDASEYYHEVEYADGGGVNEKKYYNNMNREDILSQTVVYDNDGESFDRYTVFTPDGSVFGMSENATGFNQYIGNNTEIEQGNHLGKKLKSVPKGIESAVLDRMIEDTYAKGGGVEISHYKVGDEIFIDYMDAVTYCDRNNLSYDEIIKTKQYAKKGGTAKYGKGGLLGEDARLEYVTDAYASDDLQQQLRDKLGIETDSLGENYVISFAYTDYGGDFLDKVAIEYFQETYPENTLVEPTGWGGQNAYVFGEPAKEWIEKTEDYPLGFEDIEDFYYEKQNEQEAEDFNYFLDEITDDYNFDREEAFDWLMENKGGYYGMTTQGLDFSYEDLTNELVLEGIIEPKEEDEDEYAEGGEVQDWMEESLESLIEETGYDDLEITIVSDNGNEFIATDGDAEYRVFKTEDDAKETAIEQVREDLEESPENFNKDFISNYIDGRDFFESALDEMNLGYAEDIKSESDDIYANRLIQEMVENGILNEDDALSGNAEELADYYMQDFVNLMTEGQLDEGNDGLDYFISNFGEEYTMRLVIDNNLINVDEASQDAVDTDGIGHFLSSYDGETVYLSNDNVAYRVN